MIESVVVTALAILGLVVDGRTLDLHFTRREITLEILHIGCGIPETPLLEREELQGLGFRRLVLEGEFLYLGPLLQRHEEQYTGLDAILLTRDAGVAHTMTALVEVERGLTRLPTWIPYYCLVSLTPCLLVYNIKVSPAIVHRYVVVAIAGDATELGILVEAVAASGVRDE